MDQAQNDISVASDRMSREHRAIKELLALMEGRTELRTFRDLLDELLPVLEDHFGWEEAPGGMLDLIRGHAPQALHAVERLVAEHAELRAEAVELRCAADRLVSGVTVFLVRLRAHEARETALLGDALYTDLGGHG